MRSSLSSRFLRGTWTDQSGRFAVRHLGPGEYLVGTTVFDPVENDPSSFYAYPGVREHDQVQRVSVTAGDVVVLPDLVLPVELPRRRVHGYLHFPDGSGASGVRIRLDNDTVPGQSPICFTAGRGGYFAYELYTDQSYWARAGVRKEEGKFGEVLAIDSTIPSGDPMEEPLYLKLKPRDTAFDGMRYF